MRSTANPPIFRPERKNKPEGIYPNRFFAPLPETARGFFSAAISTSLTISRIGYISRIGSLRKTGDLASCHILRRPAYTAYKAYRSYQVRGKPEISCHARSSVIVRPVRQKFVKAASCCRQAVLHAPQERFIPHSASSARGGLHCAKRPILRISPRKPAPLTLCRLPDTSRCWLSC